MKFIKNIFGDVIGCLISVIFTLANVYLIIKMIFNGLGALFAPGITKDKYKPIFFKYLIIFLILWFIVLLIFLIVMICDKDFDAKEEMNYTHYSVKFFDKTVVYNSAFSDDEPVQHQHLQIIAYDPRTSFEDYLFKYVQNNNYRQEWAITEYKNLETIDPNILADYPIRIEVYNTNKKGDPNKEFTGKDKMWLGDIHFIDITYNYVIAFVYENNKYFKRNINKAKDDTVLLRFVNQYLTERQIYNHTVFIYPIYRTIGQFSKCDLNFNNDVMAKHPCRKYSMDEYRRNPKECAVLVYVN